jgi:uncharacterized membrane protein
MLSYYKNIRRAIMIKLIGILIIIIGFLMKLDTIAVVVVAGVATGLVSGMSFNDIVTTLGKAFVENRYEQIEEEDHQAIKGLNAGVENYGNFLGKTSL